MKLLALMMFSALIFEPGEGLFRETAPRQTEGWLGLYCGEICELRPARLEYRLIANDKDRLDAETRPRGAFFVFRDVPGMKTGPVPEAPFEEHSALAHDAVVPLVLKGEKYELSVRAADRMFHKAVITLRHGSVSQVIYRMPEFVDEGHLQLAFAGDLDGDGKLDLIMSNSPKYSYYPLTLYLSTAAKPGELVGEAAQADRYSC